MLGDIIKMHKAAESDMVEEIRPKLRESLEGDP